MRQQYCELDKDCNDTIVATFKSTMIATEEKAKERTTSDQSKRCDDFRKFSKKSATVPS